MPIERDNKKAYQILLVFPITSHIETENLTIDTAVKKKKKKSWNPTRGAY